MPPNSVIQIRQAVLNDVPTLTELCRQLGYEVPQEQLQKSLAAVLASSDKTVLVGTNPAGEVLAWIGLELRILLEMAPMVEITGFVVDEAHRGQSVGSRLLNAAEAWAQERGIRRLFLRSNVIRHDAHHFYLQHGYYVTKSQHVLVKSL